MSGETIFEPEETDLVWDKSRSKVGQVMASGPTTVTLRPVGGGLEWDVHRADIRRPTVAEELGARATVANISTRVSDVRRLP